MPRRSQRRPYWLLAVRDNVGHCPWSWDRARCSVARMRTFTKYSLAALALVTVSSAAVVATATASAQRQNGSIVFRRYLNADQSWGAVFTVGIDGKGARQVTHPPRGIIDDQPSWSPDGSLIAFTRCADGALCHTFVVAPDGSGLAPIGALCAEGANEQTCADDANVSFSPDSKQVALTQSTGRVKQDPHGESWIEHSALAVANHDGSGRHVVYQRAAFSGDLVSPAFSPDGKNLVFEFVRSGFASASKRALYVVGIDGSSPLRLTPWAENDGDHPDWSPDGKWIVFHSHVDDPSGQSQFFVVHPDGTGRKQLTHFPSGTWVGRASFSPDGKAIVFGKGPEGGNIDVFTMRLDGSHIQRVTRSPLWESAPDWGPAP